MLSLCFRAVSLLPRKINRKSFILSVKKNQDLLFSSDHTSLIITNHDLLIAVDKLSKCKEIALDLEFDRNSFSYGFNLCFIQIQSDAPDSHTYLIDPMSPQINLTPLYKHVLENNKIVKVIHSPSEDLRLLQTLKCYTTNIFDTGTKLYCTEYVAINRSRVYT